MLCYFSKRVADDSCKQIDKTAPVQGTVCSPESRASANPGAALRYAKQPPQQHAGSTPCRQPACGGSDSVNAAGTCAGFPAAGRRPEPGANCSAGRTASAAQARSLAIPRLHARVHRLIQL